VSRWRLPEKEILEEFHRETLTDVSFTTPAMVMLKDASQVMTKLYMFGTKVALFLYITSPGWLEIFTTCSGVSGRQ